MWNKKMKDPKYFDVHTAITFTLNKIKGKAVDEEVDRLTDEYFALVEEFDGAMKDLAKKRKEVENDEKVSS